MKLRKFSLLLALLSIIGIGFITSCSDNSTTPTENTAVPNAPTGLMANSIDKSTVGLKWTLSSSEKDSLFKGYTIDITGGASMNTIELAKGSTNVDISNLSIGTEYTFTVKAVYTNGKTSVAAVISWAPAYRFTDIKLYESASGYGSGLQLYEATSGLPQNLTVGNKEKWDIGLDTKLESYDIGTPYLLSYTGFDETNTKKTLIIIDTLHKNVTSLDDVYDTQLMMPTTANSVNFNGVTTGFIIVVKTVEGNFAKILLKPSGGQLLQGTSPNRYVLVDISYQKIVNKPYALAAPGNPYSKKLENNAIITNIKKTEY